jgi:hypothetical protein
MSEKGPTPSLYPEGVPGITPHLNLAATDANVPTFTAADASAYSLAHPPIGYQRGTPLTVKSVEFMTDAKADKVLDLQIGLEPTALVCLVWVTGQFRHVPAVPRSINPDLKPITWTEAYIVYNARTGNILVES